MSKSQLPNCFGDVCHRELIRLKLEREKLLKDQEYDRMWVQAISDARCQGSLKGSHE